MARQLQQLQPIAWSFNHLPEHLRYVHALKMPPIYQQTLADIPKQKFKAPPISSLHDTLASSSHSIITFPPYIYNSHESYPIWFYTTSDSLDTNRLRLLFNKWLVAIGEPTKQISETTRGDFIWDHIDLMQADYEIQRMILPNLVARWLIDQEFALNLFEQTYQLRLIPIISQRYETTLITEPITRQGESFSFILRFWLKQLPYEQKPVLLHKTGIRRWLNKRISITWGKSKSLYLRRSAGYLENQPRSDVFTRLTVKSVPKQGATYLGRQSDLLDLLPLEGELPPIEEFVNDPSKFQDIAMMPVANTDNQYPYIKSGIESSDHREIFNNLTQALSGIAQPMPYLDRVKKGDSKRLKAPLQDQTIEEKLVSVGTVKIEIHSPRFRVIAQHLLNRIGISNVVVEESPVQIYDSNNQLRLEIIKIRDNQLRDILDNTSDKEEKRIQYIEKNYPQPNMTTGVMIELPNYKLSNQSKRDPKDAIRHGMTRVGRVSQFIVPAKEAKKTVNHRLQSATADLWRMLGYRQNPFYRPHPDRNLPPNLDLLAFWIFRLNKRKSYEKTVLLPVIADVPAGHPHMRLIIPSPSGRTEYYPNIYEVIQALASWSGDFTDDVEIISFFRSAIEERDSVNPTLLMMLDSNLRSYFDELNNLSDNQLSLFGILDSSSNIRVARIRFSDDNDAPFCIPPEPKSKYQGLYAKSEDPKSFYSLHNIGNQHIHSQGRKLARLNKPSVNPSTVLIQLCNLQRDDDAEEWAGLVHRLRLGSLHIDFASKLPQPLHDIDAMRKYIPRYQEEDNNDELNTLGEYHGT